MKSETDDILHQDRHEHQIQISQGHFSVFDL